jgi:hypothetical protein
VHDQYYPSLQIEVDWLRETRSHAINSTPTGMDNAMG